MNFPHVINTTNLWLFLVYLTLFLSVEAKAQAPDGYAFPEFRTVSASTPPELDPNVRVELLADADFPPYSFVAASGAPAGLTVELALAACREAKTRCHVTVRPFDELLPALGRGEAQVIITGPLLDEKVLQQASMTWPYFRILGRFTVLTGNPAKAGDAVTLAGKRIGVVKDTVHARWVETYYGNSNIISFDDELKAGEALRTGNVDAVFGDNLRLIYWVSGQASRGCCRLLGGAYSDFDHFSRNLAFLVRPDRPDLRAAFDYGLDMAQKNGTTAKIFNAYVPLSPW